MPNTPTVPTFSAIKTAQALNFFLKESADDSKSRDGKKYLKLIKLLWAADRFSLRNFGTELTEDRYAALTYGPVASSTYNLIRACKPNEVPDPKWTSIVDAQWWKEHFETRDYDVAIISDPGTDHLSKADILMLEKAYEHFRSKGAFEAACDISHVYPEWTRAFVPNSEKKSFRIQTIDFFDDPENQPDEYFQVDPEVLKAAREHFVERNALREFITQPTQDTREDATA
ncbi:Panacea domain-containing protein [Corynebacterium sp. 13CS0277]|uniref:Panacea domain-containing protein n=1 Tax=Corynebacterium sp. 13CS0277 TaxID=2071994 RepID=UPI001304B5CE|nr:Panacea domain-containing protein [Corynebacterium sp. 13CS0277]